jgi:hypothetical protein
MVISRRKLKWGKALAAAPFVRRCSENASAGWNEHRDRRLAYPNAFRGWNPPERSAADRTRGDSTRHSLNAAPRPARPARMNDTASTDSAPPPAMPRIAVSHPPGHFYSPIVDPADAERDASRLWPAQPRMLGIDMDDAGHLDLLDGAFARFLPEYDYPEHGDDADGRFYTRNSQFSWLDSRSLFVLLRHWQPRRIIEVGSGYSSLLMADVNRRFFDGGIDITCIEPYPRSFLAAGVDGIARLLTRRVQDVDLATYDALAAGDVLFIDSSHVAKTGSDVNHLYFEVLPRLRPGVRVHIHDVFLPFEYKRDWVIDQNRSWNEQYLLRALLMHSSAFRVRFGCEYALRSWPDRIRTLLAHPRGVVFGGGSFWIERI